MGAIKRGQYLSTAVVALSLICALALALLGMPWQVVAIFVAPPLFAFGTSLVRAIREPRGEPRGSKDAAEDSRRS